MINANHSLNEVKIIHVRGVLWGRGQGWGWKVLVVWGIYAKGKRKLV